MMEKINESIGVIGLGRMGRCLIQGLLESNLISKSQIGFTTKHPETLKQGEIALGIKSYSSNEELMQKCDIIILAVKPQNVAEVLADCGDSFSPSGKTFISIAASVSTHQLESYLPKGMAVLRAMPNTPAFVRAGMTAVCLGTSAGESDWKRAASLFKPLGRVSKVDEKHMNAVTGLSGCGPAYIYVVLESMADAGIKVGLPRELATELAAQTVLGAAKMLQETGRHPASLKDEVTTPAGCTIDGLLALEEGKLRVTIIKAIVKATKRARILAKSTVK